MSGLATAMLEHRRTARAPVWLFRAGFGWLFGGRMLLLVHRGRTTGARRYAVLEVVDRPAPDRYLVVSGFGERAQWLRNVRAHPGVLVVRGRQRPAIGTASVLTDDQARVALERYAEQHPQAWRRFRPVLERTFGAPLEPGGPVPPVVALDVVPARGGRTAAPVGLRIADAMFGHPRGVAGQLGAVIMTMGNAGQEADAVQAAGLRTGDRVLVVGAGPGVGLRRAAHDVGPTGKVVGLDPSPLMLRTAARRCRREVARGTVTVRAGSAEHTGCTGGTVDAAISVNNVMLWDRRTALDELARVLRPGGRLVISCHRRFLPATPADLAQEITAAGFTRLDQVETPAGAAVRITATRA